MSRNEKNAKYAKRFVREDSVLAALAVDWIGDRYYQLYPVKSKGKMGFVNEQGKIVVPMVYDSCELIHDTFSDKFIVVMKDGCYGVIRHDGTEVTSCEWQSINFGYLSEKLVPVQKNNLWGFVNVKKRKIQIPPMYDEVLFFEDGEAPVCMNGAWGLIDRQGNFIIEPKYDSSFRFCGDFAMVRNWYGKAKVPVIDTFCTGYNRDRYWLHYEEREFYEYKLINRNGVELIKNLAEIRHTGPNVFRITRISTINNGLLCLFCKEIREEHTIGLFSFSDGYVVVEDGIYFSGMYSAKGKKVKDLSDVEMYYRDARYHEGGHWYQLDTNGKRTTLDMEKYRKVYRRLKGNKMTKVLVKNWKNEWNN